MSFWTRIRKETDPRCPNGKESEVLGSRESKTCAALSCRRKNSKTVKTVVWNNGCLSVENSAFTCGEWKEIVVQLERLKELAKNQ